MKKALQILAAATIAGTVMVGCKGVVSVKKLDGEWKVVSGTGTGTYSTTYNSSTTTTTMSSDYDGTTLTMNNTSGGITTTTEQAMTIDMTFDKKTNEYTRTEVVTAPEYDVYTVYYYEFDGVYYNYVGTLTATMARVSTTTSSGLFTLTGDAGDELEKNSQIVFQQSESSTTYNDTYSYASGSTTVSASGKYLYQYNSNTGNYEYVLLPTAETGTSTNNGVSNYSEIWTVSELSKGTMTVMENSETDYSDTGSDYSYHSTEDFTWNLEQQ